MLPCIISLYGGSTAGESATVYVQYCEEGVWEREMGGEERRGSTSCEVQLWNQILLKDMMVEDHKWACLRTFGSPTNDILKSLKHILFSITYISAGLHCLATNRQ